MGDPVPDEPLPEEPFPEDPLPDGAFGEDPDQALRRFTAEADVADAVRRLGEESWLRLQSEESAHLSGLLLDLVERSEAVELVLVNGSRPAGRLEALGRDLVAVRFPDGDMSLVGRSAIDAIRLPADAPDLVGDRPDEPSAERLDLRAALGRLLVDRPTVGIWTRSSPDPVEGVLARIGMDTLVVTEDAGSVVHVPLAAVGEARLSQARNGQVRPPGAG